MDPQEPVKVLVFQVTAAVGQTAQMVHPVHIGPSLQGLVPQGNLPEGAVLVHGQAPVEHQVAVHDLVQGTVAEEEPHMPVQLFAVKEIVLPVLNDFGFLRGIFVGMFRVVGWKIRSVHFVLFPIGQGGDPSHRVDFVKEQPVFHLEFRMPEHGLTFRLEEHYIDGFHQGVFPFGLPVIFPGKNSEVAHADAVAVFQNFPVVVPHVVADHVNDTGNAAHGRPHPQHIVVAPLDVYGVVLHKLIHDLMGVGPPVINVTHNVQVVYCQPFDDTGKGVDEGTEAARLPDGIQNLRVIGVAVLVFPGNSMHQFVQHIPEIFRHGLTDFGPCVFRRQQPGQPQQTAQGDLGPGF